MNWTGGQLRRHSARKGVLSKTQRHNFAKSRQLANDRSSRKPVSFPGFLSRRDEFGLDDLTEVQEGEKKQEESVTGLLSCFFFLPFSAEPRCLVAY